jgi:cell wall-associated NlpC family hydrolase
MAAGLAGAVVLGGSTLAHPSAGSSPEQTSAAVALSAATTSTTTTAHRRHRHHGLTGHWRARVLRVAGAQTGDRYRYGAEGPNSFDCSGLTSYVYRRATGRHLPHNSAAQARVTRRIPARAARPGDLVFFHDGSHVYHVGIYIGHHRIIHAPYPGQRVKRERIWTSAVSYGRVR